MSRRRLPAAVKEVAELVVAVHINRELHRFEAYQGGAVAGFVAYEMDDGKFRFTLTQLSRDFRNIHFGEALIRAVLNDAQRRRIEVLDIKLRELAGQIVAGTGTHAPPQTHFDH